LAGHIHEGYGKENVSETLAVNAGLESYVMVELEDGKIENIEFSPELDD
jgi:Icc-related predicted phosphoesterase